MCGGGTAQVVEALAGGDRESAWTQTLEVNVMRGQCCKRVSSRVETASEHAWMAMADWGVRTTAAAGVGVWGVCVTGCTVKVNECEKAVAERWRGER